MSAVVLRGVTRVYDGRRVLDAVSLSAPEGRVVALLGPSGSGKSTILRLIAGLEPLDAGEILIGDERASAPAYTVAPERRSVGMVFQDFALFPHLTAAGNVAFGLPNLTRAARDIEALRWLDRVGLCHRAGAFPHELSGGEQQRVALVRALAPKPRAVLLDEPFSGLDPTLRDELRDLTLTALAEAGATTFFVTHDAEEALLVADRLVILKAGKVLQDATPREAYDQPASLGAAAALGMINTFMGRVERGAVSTPFGPVSARGLAEGAAAQAAVRAESVQLTLGTQARVRSVRPHGAHDLVTIEVGSALWRALTPRRQDLGERVDVSFDAAGAFAFAAD
jgi:iron(III) transport system ATP-binding protein